MSNTLRTQMRRRRTALPPQAIHQASLSFRHQALHKLSPSLNKSTALNIAFYWPFQGELDTRPLARELYNRYKAACFLPVLDSRTQTLNFMPWNPMRSVRSLNRFGIPEPKWGEPVSIGDIDILLMPLTAFDKKGNRMGMGGGWYDRTLARYRYLKKPLRIGVGYRWQQTDQLVKQPWDISCHLCITD